jgi:hypothetical protein
LDRTQSYASPVAPRGYPSPVPHRYSPPDTQSVYLTPLGSDASLRRPSQPFDPQGITPRPNTTLTLPSIRELIETTPDPVRDREMFNQIPREPSPPQLMQPSPPQQLPRTTPPYNKDPRQQW